MTTPIRVNREAIAILEELGIGIVAKNVQPKPGQTRSVATIQRIIRREGVDHARMALMLICESENNRVALDEVSIGAVSDVLLALKKNYPKLCRDDVSTLFAFFDQTPIAVIRAIYTDGLDSIVNKRAALSGMIWERAINKFGNPQLDWLYDRRVRA